jgi:serine/threonine-protein kinase
MNLEGRSYGHIRVDRILGQGGMGDVYEGYDERLARRVALKVLNSEGQLDEEARTRLTREARTLSKLDHPNICRIYDFIDDGKSDVLVLELIDGRTLQEAMRDGLSSAEKLRIARDVASVLVAAHRAGIIHRDLKPENVMLTKTGEVKVLDFGLARWIKRKSGRSFPAIAALPDPPARLAVAAGDSERTAILGRPPLRAADDGGKATTVGMTVGTPLYMSPEQARGEPLTTASDIYSFGLMLQAMFTGAEPYAEGLTAHQIMLKASRGDALPVTGVRHDVTALIKSFKALAPSDRPTAGDALRRMERIIETPKRIARRVAVAALLALIVLGVWKYTVDLRRERAAAQKAEAEARQRRAQADSLIEFMLGDLRTKLEPVGRLDVLDAAAERSLAYMSSLDPTTLSPHELAKNAKALSQLGEVRIGQGNLSAAVEVFRKSLQLAMEAHRRAPGDPELTLGVGTAHFWLGSAWLKKGELASALSEMQEYRRLAEELAVKYPASDKYQLERAYGHSVVAKVLETRGDLAGAAVEYRVVEEVKRARANAAPDDVERQADLALTLNNLGYVVERLGDLAAARDYFEREFSISASLVQRDPQHTLWKNRLANSHSHFGFLLMNIGDTEHALEHWAAAVALYRELTSRDPANADWQRNVAVSEHWQGDVLRTRGRLAEALSSVANAEADIKEVRRKDPKRPSWQRDEANVELTFSRILLAAGRRAEARTKAAAAVAMWTEISGKTPALLDLARADIGLGDAEAAMGNRAAGERAWASAEDLLQPQAHSSNPVIAATYAMAMLRRGKSAEAAPLVDAVHRAGYRHFDFERACCGGAAR